MRPRLQMCPDEARAARDRYIRDLNDLAWWVGATSESIGDIRSAIQERFGASFHTKKAILPREELWRIRFLRAPGGWLTTGERLRPEPTERVPGGRLPTFVRQRVPLTRAGTVPRSLAPRMQDLPRLAPGLWKHTKLRRQGCVPTLDVLVDAPVRGVTIVPVSVNVTPLVVGFPVLKTDLLAGLRALEVERVAAKRQQLREHLRRA